MDYWTKNNLIKPQQRVVCAANRNKESGRIICSARHWDDVMRSQKLESETFHGWEQGFLTQFCEFLTREEAYIIAKEANQIIKPDCGSGDKKTLYSEMLY